MNIDLDIDGTIVTREYELAIATILTIFLIFYFMIVEFTGK